MGDSRNNGKTDGSLATISDKSGKVASQKAIERRLKSVNKDQSQPTKGGQEIREVWYKNKHWFSAAFSQSSYFE